METTDPMQTLDIAIRKAGSNIIEMPLPKFLSFAEALDKEQLTLLMNKFRGTRDFYKKILKEEYRKKNPNCMRYQEAERYVKLYNERGKKLKEIIDSK